MFMLCLECAIIVIVSTILEIAGFAMAFNAPRGNSLMSWIWCIVSVILIFGTIIAQAFIWTAVFKIN